MTYEEMLSYCESKRDAEGFCTVCNSCSGSCISNLASDRPFAEGVEVYRGGHHGQCRFVVDGKPIDESKPETESYDEDLALLDSLLGVA